MNFEEKYSKIKNPISNDIRILEQNIKKTFKSANPLSGDLLSLLTAPAKRLRPVLGMLFLKSLFGDINQKQTDILLAVELIHNATLIHDDVIDNSVNRRSQETLNSKFDNNLAVIAGDFMLSVAMEKIISTGAVDVIKLCASALKSTCLGEIDQYFNKFKVATIDDYIEKSREKTAFLFEIAVLGGLFLCEQEAGIDLKKIASEFSQNFGIAFQIRDDLINVLKSDCNNNDILAGIYTAPLIFAVRENANILSEKNIPDAINKTKGIEKTKDLMDNYFNNSILSIKQLEDNIYKRSILELIELLRTDL